MMALAALSAATFAFAQETADYVPPLTEAEKTRVINLSSNMANRTESVIARFENILQRLESRMVKLELAGVTTTDERFYIEEAKKNVTAAKEQMNNIDVRITEFVNAREFVLQWFAVRDSFLEAKAVLESAQELITNTARDLREKENNASMTRPVDPLTSN